MLPPSVSELLPEGHILHLILHLVQEYFDLTPFFQSYRQGAGQPPYHPAMMAAVFLLAYSKGIRSSRKIAKACEEGLDFIAITDRQAPDHHSFARFRKRHHKALSGLFDQTVELCRELGMVSFGHVSVDSARIKANASKHKAMSYGRMEGKADQLQASVTEWFEEANREDEVEDALYGEEFHGDEVPDWVKDKAKRANCIEDAKRELEARAEAAAESSDVSCQPGKPPPAIPKESAQWNFTDSESRIVPYQGGFIQGFSAHAAADTLLQVIVGRFVARNGSDARELRPMVEETERATGRLPDEISADAGYCSEDILEYLEYRGIRGYVATGRQKHGFASATGGRSPPKGKRRKAMRLRLKRGGRRSRYRFRKQTMEPVFGQIKQRLGFRQFHFRGRENVGYEWGMARACHNLLRVWKNLESIGGLEELKRRLQGRKGGGRAGSAAEFPVNCANWLLTWIQRPMGEFSARIAFVGAWSR